MNFIGSLCLGDTVSSLQSPCFQLIPAWITRYPGVLSFALPKNSPYKVFLDIAVIKLRETGPWHLLRARYLLDTKIVCSFRITGHFE